MEKTIHLLFLFLASSFLTHAQQLRPQVLGSAGTSQADLTNNARLNFTVGETAIATLSAPGISFGQGFHNGAILTVDTEHPDLADWGLKVYPNPAVQTLFVEVSSQAQGEGYEASVWDISGRQLTAPQTLNSNTKNAIEVSALPAGTYLLQIGAADGRRVALRFVKTQ